MAESEEELKGILMKVKEESKNAGLKPNVQKVRSWHLVPSLHGKRWAINGKSDRLYFLGLKNHWMMTVAMKLKDTCSLEEKYDKPGQHIKKQRYHFADKVPHSQSYDFSSSHAWV